MGMNPEIKKKWVDALRSGDYKQTEGTLQKDDAFCCLGVLCDIAEKEGIVKAQEADRSIAGSKLVGYQTEGAGYWEYDILPYSVARWAGLDQRNPTVTVSEPSNKEYTATYILSDLNDDFKWDFSKIADVIEEQL